MMQIEAATAIPLQQAAQNTVDERRSFLWLAALMLALAVFISGCGSMQSSRGGSAAVTARIDQMPRAELDRAAKAWGARYEKDRSNIVYAMNFAAALRGLNRTQEAVNVLRGLVVSHPDNRDVQAAYAKALVSNGNLQESLNVIDRAQNPENLNWRLVNAKATVLDQMGRHKEAREHYAIALKVVPGEPTVLSNLGLSYALTGDLQQAEQVMRQAINVNNPDTRVRANLALVVALQGRFAEAEQIASKDLSPEQAQANITYLRQMLSQDNRWNRLKKVDQQKRG